MEKLTKEKLYTLEKYAEIRSEFRQKVIDHKKNRRLPIGPHATLYFEDSLTMQYQVQEMLRVEKVFEIAGIQEELDAYNPLIPDGCNWKATFMIEFEEESARRAALARMLSIESAVWMQVAGHDKVIPVADEDLERSNDDKTSSVHFLRFELSGDMTGSLKQGASLSAGINHDAYRYTIDPVPDNVRQSLISDLE